MIDAVALLHKYHAALNANDLEKVSAMFADDAVYVSPGLNGEIKGRAAIMQSMRSYFAEFADQISTDESVTLTAPFTVRSFWYLKATSNKTGNASERRGSEFVTFNEESLIIRVEVSDDI